MVEDAVNSAAGRLRGDIDRLRADLNNLGRDVVNLFRNSIGAGKTASTRVGDRFKDMPSSVSGRVGEAIETKPLAVIGTAFAAGIIAGMLLKGRG